MEGGVIVDWTMILTGVISSITTILVAVITFRQVRYEKRVALRDAREEKLRELREERDRLQINMVATTMALALISAKKLCNHETNGEVEKAIKDAADAQLAYKKFCERTIQVM